MQRIPVYQHDPSQDNGKIYVRLTEGHFQNLRRAISGSLMALFFITVWLQVDGQQAVLFDFASRRLFLFGLALSPQQLVLLSGFMIVGALLLFAMATAYSRIWCGFACPQSIWTWLFIRLETLAEGNRVRRIRRDSEPMLASNIARRLLKHSLWLLFSLISAATFVGYFTPIRELVEQLITLQLEPIAWSWILIIALLTYTNAGLAREKVCAHMCPYARFQSSMYDPDTRMVSYDVERGEPRGRSKKRSTGDCIDCKLCIEVCPTGIDIRQGLQSDCLSCGACIDACDAIMDKLERPRGLISFRSEHQQQGQRSPLFRRRLNLYIASIALLCSSLGWAMVQRQTLLIEVERDRQALYQQDSQGRTCNDYQLTLENLEHPSARFSLSVAQSDIFELTNKTVWQLDKGRREAKLVRVCLKSNQAASTANQLQFVAELGELRWTQATTFLGPISRH